MKSKPNSHSQLEKFKQNTLNQTTQTSVQGGFHANYIRVVEEPGFFLPRIEGNFFQGFVICVPTSGGSVF